MKNIGIFGIGCIGSILSKYLSYNKDNTYFYYSRSNKNAIEIHFLNEVTTIPIKLEEQENRQLDWIIICLKEYHVADAWRRIEKLINDNTKVVVFRNGIDLALDYLKYSSSENILETIIDCPTQKRKTGEILQLSKPKITLPNHNLASEFISLFDKGEIEINTTDDFKVEQWKKLIESSAIGALQVKYRQPCSVFNDPEILEEYEILIKEGIEVSKSIGIELGENYFNDLIKKITSYPANKGSSMLSDALEGKQLEIEAKLGAIVKVARTNNIYVPSSESLYELLSK